MRQQPWYASFTRKRPQGTADHVQILTPYRVKTVNGANELNRSLEDLINPPSPGKKELSAGGQTYREGDKVLQNKNTLMASNGDLGRITDFYTDEEGTVKTVIEFPDGRVVTYETEDLEMIEHANAYHTQVPDPSAMLSSSPG